MSHQVIVEFLVYRSYFYEEFGFYWLRTISFELFFKNKDYDVTMIKGVN